MPVIELPEAKDHLHITGSDHDSELEGFIAAAESAIARKVGPLVPTVTTDTIYGFEQRHTYSSGVGLLLSTRPVISVTSVTPLGGSALTLGAQAVDDAGVLSWAAGSPLAVGTRYTVVYVAGYADVPEDLRMAVKEMLRHLWKSQRGGTQRPGSGARAAAMSSQPDRTLPGFLYPNFVVSLIEPYMLPAFA